MPGQSACLLQDSLQVFRRDVAVPNTDHPVARRCQEFRPGVVVATLRRRVMSVSLQLENDPFRNTVKVHDEAMHDMLPAKLETEHAPVAEQAPRVALGGSALLSQLTSRRVQLSAGKGTKWIHEAE